MMKNMSLTLYDSIQNETNFIECKYFLTYSQICFGYEEETLRLRQTQTNSLKASNFLAVHR